MGLRHTVPLGLKTYFPTMVFNQNDQIKNLLSCFVFFSYSIVLIILNTKKNKVKKENKGNLATFSKTIGKTIILVSFLIFKN